MLDGEETIVSLVFFHVPRSDTFSSCGRDAFDGRFFSERRHGAILVCLS